MDWIAAMRLYETTGKINGSPRDMVGDAVDEIERLRAALTNISECADMWAELYASDSDMAADFAVKANEALKR